MIKKICVLIIACVVSTIASCGWFEIKPGYFLFSNHKLRKIYHNGFSIQASGSYQIYDMILLYGSLGHVHVKGKSLQGNQKTSISKIPVDLGIRTIADFSESVKGYFTFGTRYFYFRQHNDSIYVNRNIRANGLGFFINGGCNFVKNDCLLLGIFGEYAFEKKSFKSYIPNVYARQNLQIGGFVIGASLGFEF